MKIKTKRLELVPLSLEEFDLLLNSPEELSKKLKLKEKISKIDDDTRFAFEWLIKQCKIYPEHHTWYTNWQIIDKAKKVAVGSFCFKGEPDINGEVEIGYGINPEYQNNGYMSEVIGSIIKWLQEMCNISGLIAETDNDNIPSQKVLTKHGFEKYSERQGMLWWRKKL